MIINPNLSVDELIQLDGTGIHLATFAQIRSALINRYKEIYGEDIDLSTNNADGVFVNELSLIINNILRCISEIYNNLNVETASGVYLDALCNLSNVSRKGATKSSVTVKVKNTGASAVVLNRDSIFIDKSGLEWNFSEINGASVTLPANQTSYTEISLICSVEGDVKAEAGWIYQLIGEIYVIVLQESDAITGEKIESDASLRARRAQSSGASGVTVLQSLQGSLLNINGIKDVYIYNNNSATDESLTDGSDALSHSVYLALKYEYNVNISDKIIGDLIHDKLTPGVRTSPVDDDSLGGEGVEYTYRTSELIVDADQNIYWKKCTPVAPEIEFTITPLPYWSNDNLDKIGQYLFNYFNNLPIGSNLSTQDILVQVLNSDPKFKGQPTFTTSLSTITINDTTSYSNPLTYYNYTLLDINNNVITLS